MLIAMWAFRVFMLAVCAYTLYHLLAAKSDGQYKAAVELSKGLWVAVVMYAYAEVCFRLFN